MTESFVLHTLESAPERSRPALAGARQKFGYVPAPMAALAESPAVVEAFGRLLGIFEHASLEPLEREVVTMTVARENECHYCVAMHTGVLAGAGAAADTVRALREGTALSDPRLEALRAFTLAVMEARGDAPDAARAAFFAAGFTPRQAFDVVLGVATYTLSTYANRLTRAPLDAPLEPFRWTKER